MSKRPERVRADALGAALRRLVPGLPRALPARIDDFVRFTPDQDLSTRRPWRRALGFQDLTRIRGELSRKLPEGVERDLLEAYAEIGAGLYAEAAERLSRRAVLAPSDARLALLEALALWLLGDERRTPRFLPRAFARVEAAVAADPSDAALRLDAQVRLEFEDTEGALADLGTLLRRRPRDLSALLGRAEAFADDMRLAEALSDLATAGEGRPSWWLSAQRGRVHGVCGRPAEALADLDAAIRRRPGHGPLLCWRAEVLRRLGRLVEARRDLDRAIELGPEYPLSWETRGRLSLIEGGPEAALRDLDEACRLDAAHSLSFAWRAEARIRLGRLEQALEDAERVYPLELRRSWNGPAGADGRMREDLFWREVDALPERYPERAAAWLLRGLSSAPTERWKEGLADLSRAAALDESARPAALAWRGYCALLAGAARAAERDLAESCRLAPSVRWTAWHGQALAALGREDEALARWEALEPEGGSLADAYLRRSEILERRGEAARAREDARTAFVLAANRDETRRRFAALSAIAPSHNPRSRGAEG